MDKKIKYFLQVVFLIYSFQVHAVVIDSLKVKNFVVKSSIILANTKPGKSEVKAICAKFNLYNNFESGASHFLDTLIKSEAFSQNIFDRYRYEYLQGVTAWQVSDEIDQYEALLPNKSLSDFTDMFKSIINKLTKITLAQKKLAEDSIGISDVQRDFLDNKFYDDINMGANNFVISTFNYLLFRNPTKAELAAAKNMINGENSMLFFNTGNSKDDYLKIMFSSPLYKEGQIRYWYSQLLNREPTTSELFDACSNFLDIKKLIKTILMKREFYQ